MELFIIPCGGMVFVFLLGVGLSWCLFRVTLIRSLERRVAWLEDQMQDEAPEPPIYGQRSVRCFYVPVEQQFK